jgi:hypothetical protein
MGRFGAVAGAIAGGAGHRAIGRTVRGWATRVGGARFGRRVGAFARANASFIGQTTGAIFGDFASKLKDSIFQARAFAENLREANRRFMFYNSTIGAAYIEADVARMMRQRTIANAVAPTTAGLTSEITRLEEINMSRDIFWANTSNRWQQLKVGMAQRFGEYGRPIYEWANQTMERLDPTGVGTTRVGRVIAEHITWTPAYVTVGLGVMWATGNPLLGIAAAGALAIWRTVVEWNRPDFPVAGQGAGEWEKLISRPHWTLPLPAGAPFVGAHLNKRWHGDRF